MEEKWNDTLEILGDAMEDVAEAELDWDDIPDPDPDPASDAEMEAHYQDWLRRESISQAEIKAAQDAIREWDWNERPWE